MTQIIENTNTTVAKYCIKTDDELQKYRNV